MELTSIRADLIEAPHGVEDEAKLARLAASIQNHGWTGRPLLVLPVGGHFQALTGSHRLAAVRSLEEVPEALLGDQDDVELPCAVVDEELWYGAGYDERSGSDDEERLAILLEVGDTEAAALMQAEIDANETND